jgi:hypothetical protein
LGEVDSGLWWLDKFKAGNINRYDGSSNHKEFIQVYLTVIEAARGDNRVKANFLPTALTGTARSWLINLPKDLSLLVTRYAPCSLGTYRAHTSVRLQQRP